MIDHHNNYDGNDEVGGLAGWGRHRLELITNLTDEWTEWTGMDGKRVGQVDFAEFIEEHISEIAEPTGSMLFEMVKTLEVKRDANWQSAINLTNGQTQFTYHEEIQGSAQKGSAQIPKEFILGLAPFEAGPSAQKYSVTARLRYRLDQGRLTLWVDLLNAEKVIEAAFRERIALVESGCGLTVLRGNAPPEVTPLV